MNKTASIIETSIVEELAHTARRLQEQRTGHPPTAVTTGAWVQVCLLTPAAVPPGNSESVNRAQDDDMRVASEAEVIAESSSESSY